MIFFTKKQGFSTIENIFNLFRMTSHRVEEGYLKIKNFLQFKNKSLCLTKFN